METTGAGAGNGPENAFGIEGLIDVSPIGSGGSARVYRATQTAFDRTVAVKVLNASDGQLQRRFDRERRAMGRLSNHPGIVPVYSSGTTVLGQPYLIMPYYGSGSLADRLERGGALPWSDSVSTMRAVSTAMAHAHNHDVVHLDLKPANVMLADDGSPLVADFGIAKILSDNTARGTTNTSFTPIFCPPEVLLGDRPGHEADVYGLGATLWALLAGHGPFLADGDGNNSIAAVMHRVSTQPPADLRHLAPGWVCDVVEHAMDKDPAARPASAHHLADLLSGPGARQATITAPPQGASPAAPPPSPDQAPIAVPASSASAAGNPPGAPTTGLGTAHTVPAVSAGLQLNDQPADQVGSGSRLKTAAALVGLLLLGLLGYGATRLLLSAGDTETASGDGDLISEVAEVSTVEATTPPTSGPTTTGTPTSEAPTSEAPTTANDSGVADGPLSGNHRLTLQWIGREPDEWGSVRFEPVEGDTYSVRGRQDGPNGHYVSIDGIVTQLSDNELRFEGTVETFVDFANNGKTCVRQGEMTFLSTQNRQYWRLQDLLNCDGVLADYVDIYF